MSVSPYPQIRLKAERISDHPWVFGSGLEQSEEKIANGSVVDLIGRHGEFLARGHFNKRARVGLRILTRDSGQLIDRSFLRQKLLHAAALRREILQLDQQSNAYRLIHGEGDGMSGLVVDVYHDLAAIQFFSHGMFRHRNDLKQILMEDFGVREVYTFAEARTQKQEGFDWRGGPENLRTEVTENGVRFFIEFDVHHKTGFYLDQRANRRRLAELSSGKSVLDICTFAGGFALAAKVAGKASQVTGIDLDPAAIELARRNMQLNNADVDFRPADLYQYLQLTENQGRFDIVVLDPAKLTTSKDKKDAALHHYTVMNRLALQAVRTGGVFLTCSCTGLISEEEFLSAIRRAGFQAGRSLQIFSITGADGDHPFLSSAPESRYLKAVWSRVY